MSLNLTREQTIANHRKMWNWIADETLKRKKRVSKMDFFREHEIPINERPRNNCYCCEYAGGTMNCYKCPINWGNKNNTCLWGGSLYEKLKGVSNYDYIEAAELARKIAELPEKEVEE